MAHVPEVTEWSELLDATRLALTSLSLEELDNLAARAEAMLAAVLRDKPLPLQTAPDQHYRLLHEQRLLGSLLAATNSNLEVLRRLHGGPSGGSDSRWVR